MTPTRIPGAAAILIAALAGCADPPTPTPPSHQPPAARAPATTPTAADPNPTTWTLTVTALDGTVTTTPNLSRKTCEAKRQAALAKPGRLETSGLTIKPAASNTQAAECRQ